MSLHISSGYTHLHTHHSNMSDENNQSTDGATTDNPHAGDKRPSPQIDALVIQELSARQQRMEAEFRDRMENFGMLMQTLINKSSSHSNQIPMNNSPTLSLPIQSFSLAPSTPTQQSALNQSNHILNQFNAEANGATPSSIVDTPNQSQGTSKSQSTTTFESKPSSIKSIPIELYPSFNPDTDSFEVFEGKLDAVLQMHMCLLESNKPMQHPYELLKDFSTDKIGKSIQIRLLQADAAKDTAAQTRLNNSQNAFNCILGIMTRSHMSDHIRDMARSVPHGNAYELRLKMKLMMSDDNENRIQKLSKKLEQMRPKEGVPISTFVAELHVVAEAFAKHGEKKDFKVLIKILTTKFHEESVLNNEYFFLKNFHREINEIALNPDASLMHVYALLRANEDAKSDTPMIRNADRGHSRSQHKALGVQGNNKASNSYNMTCNKCMTKGHSIRNCSNAASKDAKICANCTKRNGIEIYGHTTDQCRSKIINSNDKAVQNSDGSTTNNNGDKKSSNRKTHFKRK